jgi:hypothetical protein
LGDRVWHVYSTINFGERNSKLGLFSSESIKWQDFFTMDAKKRGLYFYALKNILTILSSPSSSFSSRRFSIAIYFSLKVDLYCHVETTRGKTR